ncbi:hypothetical protein A6A04_02530 [Paramagnetospirillum marisnigri]|uniref:NAD-dependent epimerase/dehydratase domain-containing protein n=2 Tax=Paramagnetospirillum marisnigri TaxID=1285242 RepID=A0A178MQS2_9PROT|nr:hypothetical protein A6A04_02530 [Paramagnetospirillum marisnigri]
MAVVGAGGFLGGFLAQSLRDAGHEVLALGRGDPLPTEPVDVLVDCNGDARRFWANANPAASFAANVASVAARATAGLADRYVFMSTMDVYGKGCRAPASSGEDAVIEPSGLDVYAFHKFLAEQLVARHAARSLILRLGTLIGPGLKKNPVFDAINGNPIRQTPDSTLSLVDLAHVAKALAMLLEMGDEGVYNVTAAAPITIRRMLDVVAGAHGRPSPDFHAELLHTDYDISIEKLSALMTMPDSETMLKASLPFITAGAA